MILEKTQYHSGVGVMVSVLVFCSGSLIADQPLPDEEINTLSSTMLGQLPFSETVLQISHFYLPYFHLLLLARNFPCHADDLDLWLFLLVVSLRFHSVQSLSCVQLFGTP